MKILRGAALGVSCFWLLGGQTPAPPAIDPRGILNAASHLPASLAGGAIARGARFTLSGIRLGPEPGLSGSQSDPPATLGSVSVRIAQGATHVQAGLFFAGPERIEGWIPDSAPLGPVSVTVTYEGRTSEPYPLTLVASSFGFFSPDEPPAAAPGATVELTGTGSGGARLAIFVGGKPVTGEIQAGADACCKGIERIQFRVPAGAPPGCAVPVQALAPEGRPSNAVALVVHPAGHPCRDRKYWFRATAKRSFRAGLLALARVSHAPDRDFDYGFASFGRVEAGRSAMPALPPPGSCTLIAGSLNLRRMLTRARNFGLPVAIPESEAPSRRLDAGPAISIHGRGVEALLQREPRQSQYYDGVLGGFPPYARHPPAPLFLDPGAYRVSAAGGADVGRFSLNLRLGRPVVWTNRDAFAEIDRATGVTLEWQAAHKSDIVLIAAASANQFTGDGAACICMAAARDGRFTIPAMSLANLPPTGEEDRELSYLVLLEIPAKPLARIRPRGLDVVVAAYLSASVRRVIYR